MYFRFVISERDGWTGVKTGIFSGIFAIKYNRHRAIPWLCAEILNELVWFQAHLDEPKRLELRGGRHGPIYGICWFRPEATEAISRARYVGWLLEEAGIPVREVRRRRSGQIIWQDDMQVVAKPMRDRPRIFH